MVDRCGSLYEIDEILEKAYLFNIQVRLLASSQDDEDLFARARAQVRQDFHLDLRGLRGDVATSDDRSKITGILDMICPGSTTAREEPNNAMLDILESSKVCDIR